MAPVKLPALRADPRDDARALTASLRLANGRLECSRTWYDGVRQGYGR